jgi:hypothetical protein
MAPVVLPTAPTRATAAVFAAKSLQDLILKKIFKGLGEPIPSKGIGSHFYSFHFKKKQGVF